MNLPNNIITSLCCVHLINESEKEIEMSTNSGNGRWTVLAGALIVQVILGTVYAFSVFVKPLEMEFGWSRATTQWAFSFALLSFAIVMIPAGRLQDRIGPRKVASIGGILLGLSFLLGAVLVAEDRPWALYLTYGIMGGAGIGFTYVCPIAASMKWFPDKKGLVTGLSVAGFGAGALFFAGPASTLLLPPGAGAEAIGLSKILLVALGISQGSLRAGNQDRSRVNRWLTLIGKKCSIHPLHACFGLHLYLEQPPG